MNHSVIGEVSDSRMSRSRTKPLRMGKLREQLPFVVLLGVALIRLLWFQGNVLADGDLLIPIDAPGYLEERWFTWNAIELGMPSGLPARLLNPLLDLAAVSQIATGSAVYGEAAYLVLFTFLSGLSIWWLTSYLSESRRSTPSLLVTSLFYMSSTFLINDGVHTAILFLHSYALIPLIIYLLIRAIKEHDTRFVIISSFLTLMIASTMPNFRDLAFLALVLALFLTYGVLSRICDRSSWRVLGKFLLYSALLNLAWILPVMINLDYWSTSIYSVPVGRVTQLSSGLDSIFRGIGKWSFDSGYQGLLYHPYSEIFGSPVFILLGFSISFFAFGSLLLSRPTKLTLFMASFTLFFLFLSKGATPPFGETYSATVLLGPLRAFRESFYFMQFVALGYAYLLGEFVEATRRYLSTSKRTQARSRRRVFQDGRVNWKITSGVSILLVTVIVVYSWPLHTGAVAVNWYTSDSHGVQFPQAYRDAAKWLESRQESSRLLILPELGNYVAYHWGYQGGSDIFHGLFRQPVITGSSWSEFAYPTKNHVNQIFEAARADDVDTFRALAYWFSIRFVLVDGSRDVAFYPELPREYYEDFLSRAGFQSLGQFDFLRLYEYSYALPLTYAATTIVPQNTSVYAPAGILWSLTDFSDGWVERPLVVERRANATYAAFQVNGTYTVFPLVINRSATSKAGYLLITFATNNKTSVSVSVRTGALDYLFALNPPSSISANHYQSTTPYVLAFLLPSTPISAIELFVTNQFAPEFEGNLEIWIHSISVATDIGRPSDIFRRISPLNEKAAFVSASDYELYFSDGQQLTPSFISSTSVSRTRYEVVYSSSFPVLLVLNEAFNPFWRATINGTPIVPHIGTNDFSNGWILPEGRNQSVIISFVLQDYHDVGFSISLVSAISIFSLMAIKEILHRKSRNRRKSGDAN